MSKIHQLYQQWILCFIWLVIKIDQQQRWLTHKLLICWIYFESKFCFVQDWSIHTRAMCLPSSILMRKLATFFFPQIWQLRLLILNFPKQLWMKMFLMFQLQSRAQPPISTLSTCSNKIIICFPKSTYNFKTISCALNLCNTCLSKVYIYIENHKLWMENTH